MNLSLWLLGAVALSAGGFAATALMRAQMLFRDAEERLQAIQVEGESALQEFRSSLEALASEIHEMQQHVPAVHVPGVPRSGFNLDKRSQAIRMHLRGDPPEQIAAALEITRQEVDLLLKVHLIAVRTF